VKAEARTLVGVGVVVLLISVINPLAWTGQGIPLLVTPIGASAALVFANPGRCASGRCLAA